jgi:hypothetical protein
MSNDNREENPQPEIIVNKYDPSVVAVDEPDRTVLLTENETIIVEKPERVDIAPSNRPRKVYGGMWGTTEIGVAAAGALALLAVIVFYFLIVGPANRELEANKTTGDRLERELASAKDKYGNITSTETQVAKLVSSVNDFEANYLPVAANGRTALYQRVNGLIGAYGLTNTSGPDFAPLEISNEGDNNQSDEERGRSRFRSLFPGDYVTMTLEGSYQNLRRFIRDVETGRDFIIISAVELEPSDSQQKQPVQQVAPGGAMVSSVDEYTGASPTRPGMPTQMQQQKPKGKTTGEVVSLRMEMAAYFRRPNILTPEETAQ